MAVAYSPQLKSTLGRVWSNVWSRESRALVVLAWGPLVFTVLAYLIGSVRIGGEFLLPAFFAVPLVILKQTGAPAPSLAVRRATIGALGFLFLGATLSPVIGAISFFGARHPLLEPRAELAAAATDFWRGATNTPLRRVAGQERPATGIVFYSEDAPLYMDGASGFWFDRTTLEIERDGLLFVCGSDDAQCSGHARKVLGPDVQHRFTFTGSHEVFWGLSGPMYTFELYLLPPTRQHESER
jgi:hypothetical protein